MTAHITDTGVFDAALELALTERELQRMELRLRCNYMRQRAAIAHVRFEHGLLTAEEQDALVLEVQELLTEIEMWKAHK
jgi:hypothetical protein